MRGDDDTRLSRWQGARVMVDTMVHRSAATLLVGDRLVIIIAPT